MSPMAALLHADAQHIPLADSSVHCVVTSPPYFGLRKYAGVPDVTFSDGWRGQLGNEPTPELYVAHMVEIFREVRRVLRDDGTLWLNLGDSYADSWGNYSPGGITGTQRPRSEIGRRWHRPAYQDTTRLPATASPGPGYKPLDLLGIPWQVAFALRADGWYLRSAIVWAKGVSGQAQQAAQVAEACQDAGLTTEQVAAVLEAYSPYVGSCMPESVRGDRWERCRVKVKASRVHHEGDKRDGYAGGRCLNRAATWQPCPGCEKCRDHGGYVLRRGNWRPTSAYELVFLLQKTDRAFTDGEGVKEEAVEYAAFKAPGVKHAAMIGAGPMTRGGTGQYDGRYAGRENEIIPTGLAGRNLRNVWAILTGHYSGAIYAVFPPDLPELCIKAGTSAYGVCPQCGAPWVRVVERETFFAGGSGAAGRTAGEVNASGKWAGLQHGENIKLGPCVASTTLGYLPTCDCLPQGETVEALDGHTYSAPVPATVLDPFAGSGTTVRVALELGRSGIGLDLSGQYLQENAAERVANVQLPLMEKVL